MMKSSLISIAVAAFYLSEPAIAQTIDPFSTDYFTKVTWNDINRRTSEQARQARKKASQSTPQRATAQRTTPRQATSGRVSARPASSPAALNFRPTGALAQSKGVNALVALYGRDQQAATHANYVAMITSFNDTVPRLYGVQK
ncbi:MAG: hypothetical protein QM676_10860 [Novosphingobium sp.]